MIQSIFDPYLLYIENGSNKFGIISLQTNNTLFSLDKTLATKKEKQLYKANLSAKKRKKPNNKIINFNSSYIKGKFNVIYLMQKR